MAQACAQRLLLRRGGPWRPVWTGKKKSERTPPEWRGACVQRPQERGRRGKVLARPDQQSSVLRPLRRTGDGREAGAEARTARQAGSARIPATAIPHRRPWGWSSPRGAWPETKSGPARTSQSPWRGSCRESRGTPAGVARAGELRAPRRQGRGRAAWCGAGTSLARGPHTAAGLFKAPSTAVAARRGLDRPSPARASPQRAPIIGQIASGPVDPAAKTMGDGCAWTAAMRWPRPRRCARRPMKTATPRNAHFRRTGWCLAPTLARTPTPRCFHVDPYARHVGPLDGRREATIKVFLAASARDTSSPPIHSDWSGQLDSWWRPRSTARPASLFLVWKTETLVHSRSFNAWFLASSNGRVKSATDRRWPHEPARSDGWALWLVGTGAAGCDAGCCWHWPFGPETGRRRAVRSAMRRPCTGLSAGGLARAWAATGRQVVAARGGCAGAGVVVAPTWRNWCWAPRVRSGGPQLWGPSSFSVGGGRSRWPDGSRERPIGGLVSDQ